MKISDKISVSVAYTDTCLPDYFSGDARPWVTIPVCSQGYTSRELRKAIMQEFSIGAVGGNDELMRDYLHTERMQKLADKFYSKALPACLNREIKFRGKRLKNDKRDDPDCECYCHIVFNVQYEKEED